MKTILLFFSFLFSFSAYSQNSSKNAFMVFGLLMYKGTPIQKDYKYNYPNKLKGVIDYADKSIQSEFEVRNSYIFFDSDSIFLGDKKLKSLDLNDNGKPIKIERIKEDNFLKRIVVDTMGFQICEPLTFNDSVNKRTIFFKYKNEYFFVKKSIFRNLNKSIIKTLNRINFENPDIKRNCIEFLELGN